MEDTRDTQAEDNRHFSTTFKKPTRVRLEHDGKTVFDQTLNGEVKVNLRDHCPPTGTTTLFIDEEPVAEWECS
jgi:hypothetical protein